MPLKFFILFLNLNILIVTYEGDRIFKALNTIIKISILHRSHSVLPLLLANPS